MLVFLNGRFVPEEQATVSVLDRSFLYGDGLFETLRVTQGKPFRWDQHWKRLAAGASFLKLSVPFTSIALRAQALELIARNGLFEAALRITLSRGVGRRGYGPNSANAPTIVMTLHAAPELASMQSWSLITSSLRINENDPLIQFKTANKLPQVLARAEAERAGADEALFLNLAGGVAECASSNLFWVEENGLFTPPLSAGALPGITRAVVMELCQSMARPVTERVCVPQALMQASGVFVSLSSLGIVEVKTFDAKPLALSPVTRDLHAAYFALVAKESLQMARGT